MSALAGTEHHPKGKGRPLGGGGVLYGERHHRCRRSACLPVCNYRNIAASYRPPARVDTQVSLVPKQNWSYIISENPVYSVTGSGRFTREVSLAFLWSSGNWGWQNGQLFRLTPTGHHFSGVHSFFGFGFNSPWRLPFAQVASL